MNRTFPEGSHPAGGGPANPINKATAPDKPSDVSTFMKAPPPFLVRRPAEFADGGVFAIVSPHWATSLRRRRDGICQLREVLLARNGDRAERGEMVRAPLHIEQRHVARPHEIDQRHQGDL